MYAPIIATITAAVRSIAPRSVWSGHCVGRSLRNLEPSKAAFNLLVQSVCPGDVFIWVGGADYFVPFANMSARGAVTVHYQTEHLGTPMSFEQCRPPRAHETWTFTWRAIDACAVNGSIWRYVPPGSLDGTDMAASAFANASEANSLIFIGKTDHDRHACLRDLGLELARQPSLSRAPLESCSLSSSVACGSAVEHQ